MQAEDRNLDCVKGSVKEMFGARFLSPSFIAANWAPLAE